METLKAQRLEVMVKRLRPEAKLPQRASSDAAGWDLRAAESLVIGPGERALVSTGIAVALPPHTHLEIRPRSGLALRHGVTILNAPGTIDADYRGEIGIILVNHGQEAFRVSAGDRVAQALLNVHAQPLFDWVEALPETERGSGGFGHTGRS